MLTTKQTTTLVLFAQNYSLRVIAKKQGVSLATIRERIKSLSENHSREFNNALALRETYKRNRESIKHMDQPLHNNFYWDLFKGIEEGEITIKHKF